MSATTLLGKPSMYIWTVWAPPGAYPASRINLLKFMVYWSISGHLSLSESSWLRARWSRWVSVNAASNWAINWSQVSSISLSIGCRRSSQFPR
jgi:hypothetical protein